MKSFTFYMIEDRLLYNHNLFLNPSNAGATFIQTT